ncbi:hypothetical protein G7Y79_00008g023850 [Physcia stellaris]|nr:hypothetical protein G7Y79_00008g023850 [Physcia stellaris]
MSGNGDDIAISETSVDKGEDLAPPDGGYGWVCVGACFIINAFSWGLTTSYGIYLAFYLNHGSFPGAQPLDFAFVGGSTFGAAMLSAPIVTVLARKYGTRMPMFIGVCSISAGFIAASFATKTWQLYISQGVMIGIGIGFLFIPSLAILPQWFLKRRSLANGITGAGSGVGGILFSLSTAAMIDRLSLQWSLRITGIMVFIMNGIATILIKDRNNVIQPQQHPFDTKLLRRCDIWLLLVWIFSTSFAIWLPANNFGVAALFGIISGAIVGIFWVAIGPLCAEIVGLQQLPSLLSLSWLTTVLPTFCGKGGKGLGKGGAKRHRKILRDNIQGITKPAIRRLARRGGVKRISAMIYEETRGVLKTFLESVIRDAVTYTEHAKRKTVTSLDVVYALKRQGRTLYGFGG